MLVFDGVKGIARSRVVFTWLRRLKSERYVGEYADRVYYTE